MGRLRTTVLVAVACLWGVAASAADAPDLSVEVTRRQARLALDVTLLGDLPEDAAGRLDEGERVAITYVVEVFRDRKLWFNDSLEHLRVEVGVRFDPTSRRWALDRSEDGVPTTSLDAGDRETALAWLTHVPVILSGLSSEQLSRRRVRYRVRAVLSKRLVMFFFPVSTKSTAVRGDVPAPSEPSGEDG